MYGLLIFALFTVGKSSNPNPTPTALTNLSSTAEFTAAYPDGGCQNICGRWCYSQFSDSIDACTSLAAFSTGPCFECGPYATDTAKVPCQGGCCDGDGPEKGCRVVVNDVCGIIVIPICLYFH